MGEWRMRAARRGRAAGPFTACALFACFSILFNLTALNARSAATDEPQLIEPAPITVALAAPPALDPALALDATAPPSSEDAPTGEASPDEPQPDDTSSAPSLGRTVLLDIAQHPATLGSSQVFAYTPCDAGEATTAPIDVLGGARLWQQPSDAMSPVTPPGGPVLGYAYPHDGRQLKPLAVSASATTVVSNLAAGGATWEWTDSSGTQFLNHYDLGREVQASFFIRTADGRKLNPTEAGDRYADQRVPMPLRHSSPLADATVEGTRQTTTSVPLEWSPPRADPRAGSTHPVIYPDVRLGKALELDYLGRAAVARYDTMLTLPTATTNGDLEAPTAYLRNEFNHLYVFDARSGALTPIAPTPFDKKGVDWVPASGWGALIASTPDGSHAFAIYAATASAGGTIAHFTANDFHVDGGASGAGDVGTVKLRALRVGNFPAGTTRTTAYIVTGSLASVQAEAAALAHDGVM